jgi:hypothetical protein
VQVLPLLDHRRRPRYSLHPRNALPDITTPTTARNRSNGLLHPVCTVDGRTHRYLDRAVGAVGQREWELQSLRYGVGELGAIYSDVGVFGAA